MRFQTKMIVLFASMIVLFGTVSSYFVYTFSIGMITEIVGTQAKQIAEISAKSIDKLVYQKVLDRILAMENRTLEVPVLLDNEDYKNLRTKLWKIKQTNGLKFLYAMSAVSPQEILVVVDGFPLDYIGGSEILLPGESVDGTDPSIIQAFSQRMTVVGELSYNDEQGEYLAAYVPLFNEDGTLLGVLAAGFEGKRLFQMTEALKLQILIFVGAGVLITILMSVVVTRYLLSPLNRLTEQAKAAREGDLTVRANLNRKDEIGQLGEAFDDMVGVFYDQRYKMDQVLKSLSQAQKRADLEIKISNEVQKIVPFQTVQIIEFDGKNAMTREGSVRPAVREYLTDLALQMNIGDLIKISDGYLVLIGHLAEAKYLLWVEGRDIKLNQRERLSIQMLCQYTSIYYENLYLLEEMTRKLQNLQNESEIPIWMSKLILQMSETERKRLASDLHDEVLQEVIKLKRMLGTVLGTDAVRDEAKTTLKSIDSGFATINDMIRETCNELLPSFLMEKGIEQSVSRYVQKIRNRANFDLHFEAFGLETPLDFDEMLTVYRVIQEMINNAMKHSKATDVDLMLREDNGKMIVYYSDNGVGMDMNVGVDRTKHLGFHGLQERIKVLGGTVSVQSAPGEGMEISCSFPMKQASSNK